MVMDNGRKKRVPIAKVRIHQQAKFAFRYTQGLKPQCDISLLKTCSTGTWSPVLPRAVKIGSWYHVFSGWHGLLYSGALEKSISIIVEPEMERFDIYQEAVRFAFGTLTFQSDKKRYPAHLAELAECCPMVNSGVFLTRPFETSRAFSYSIAPIDKKSVNTQWAKLHASRVEPVGGDS